MYNITQYSFKKAKELNIIIRPSKNKNKKIDVYKGGDYLTYIGDIKYKDYPFIKIALYLFNICNIIHEEGFKYCLDNRHL